MRIPWFKILRVFLFIIIAVITIAALTLAWFNYQGRKEWAKSRTELLARGEKLVLADMAPPEIPPEENFFADPLWEEVFDMIPVEIASGEKLKKPRIPVEQQQISQLARRLKADEIKSLEQQFPEFSSVINVPTDNVVLAVRQRAGRGAASSLQLLPASRQTSKEAAFILAVLEPSAGILQRFSDLAKRSSARAPICYEDNFSPPLPHAMYLFRNAQILRLRAEARLTLGDSSGALEDTLLIFYLAKTMETEPFPISLLVRASMYRYALSVIKLGIAVWPEAELLKIEQAISQINLIDKLPDAFRAERGEINAYIDAGRKKSARLLEILRTLGGMSNSNGGSLYYITVPLLFNIYRFAFLDSDHAFYNKLIQEKIDSMQLNKQHFRLKNIKSIEYRIKEKLEAIDSNPWTRIQHLLSSNIFEAAGISPRIFLVQDEINQGIIACALQRWALTKGSLPEALEELIPVYLSALPPDVITEGPMHYRRTSNNTYDLWSVGWNETDEGGKPTEERKQEADWVWNPTVVK